MAERSELLNRLTDPPKKRDTAENRAAAAADFILGAIRGAAKAVTTDLPGFLMDAADQLSGAVKSFGEKDRSEQLFSAMTGTGKKSEQAELVGSFANPIAAVQAMIVPALAVKPLKTVKEAQKALEAGVSETQVFKDLGIYKGPVGEHDGVLRAILSDEGVRVNITPNRYDMISAPLRPQPLGEILNHPELFKAIPEFANYNLGKAAFGQYRGALFDPRSKYIGVGAYSTNEEFTSAVLHEVGHAIQNKFSMIEGSSPSRYFQDPKSIETAKSALSSLLSPYGNAARTKAREAGFFSPTSAPESPERTKYLALQEALGILTGAERTAYNNYRRVGGEVEADIIQTMFEKNLTDPLPLYKISADQVLMPDEIGKRLDQDPVIQAIIRFAQTAKTVQEAKTPAKK